MTNSIEYGTIRYNQERKGNIMTVYVKDTANSVLSGLSKMKTAMIEDYNNFMPDNKRMCDEYAEKLTISYGKKYIKIFEEGGGVKAFVVGVDNDKKFKKKKK